MVHMEDQLLNRQMKLLKNGQSKMMEKIIESKIYIYYLENIYDDIVLTSQLSVNVITDNQKLNMK